MKKIKTGKKASNIIILLLITSIIFVTVTYKDSSSSNLMYAASYEDLLEEEITTEEEISEIIENASDDEDSTRPDLTGIDLTGIRLGMAFRHGSNDTYMTSYFQHIKNYAKSLGVDLVLLDAVDDVTKQYNQVQDLIEMDLDVIMIWPVNSQASATEAYSVYQSGIPCLMCNSNVSERGVKYTVGFVGPDDYTEGYKTGTACMERMGEISGDEKILFVEGVNGQQQALDRKEGVEAVLAEYGLEFTDSQTCEGKREKAQQITENWLVKYQTGEIDAILTFDDNAAVGVYNAALAAGREGEFPIWAAATGDYILMETYIETGKIAGSALQSPITESETALEWACWIAAGNQLPRKEIFIDTPILTAENWDEVSTGNFELLI